jgi:hypothetical protein
VSPDEAVWQWCADGAEIDPEKLRKMWEFMVDAGANHSTQEQEPAYLNILTVLMDVRSLRKIISSVLSHHVVRALRAPQSW